MSRVVIRIGRPVHWRPTSANVTACGLVGAELAAYDVRDVECLTCRNTRLYRARTGPRKNNSR